MSPRRRSHGSGSVTQRKDGYWIGRYEAGYTASGARRRRTVTGKTKSEAERRLREAMKIAQEDGRADGADVRLTVKGWSETWLPMHQKKVRPNTYTTNAGALRKWVLPTIGHKRLSSLTPADIRAIATAAIDAGRSTTTARQAQTVATGMLKAARLEGHTVPERIFDVELVPQAPSDRDVIPEADAVAILDASLEHPREAARWGLALLAALRPGEACGLRWSDIDFDEALVKVEWQLQSLPYLDRADKARGFRVPLNYEAVRLYGAYHLTRPKNRRGYRLVPLVSDAVNALAAWRAVAPPNEWGLVFTDTDPRDGRGNAAVVRSKKIDARHWIEVQDRAQVAHVDGTQGRRYVNYENRHTTATLLDMLGVPASVREQIVGHSAMVAARHYVHVQQTDARAALESVSARLELVREQRRIGG